MKTTALLLPLATALSGATGARAAVDARAVRSQTPYACNAVGGVAVTFAEDMGAMRAAFRDLRLSVQTPSHGLPPSRSAMRCLATVEFAEPDFGAGSRQARFAVAGVAWSNADLSLDKGDDLKVLGARVDLDVEVTNETSPVRYPIGKDRYSSNLVNLQVNPAVGVDKPYSGEFNFTAKNPNPTFTPCFLGRSGHALKFDFDIFAETVDGGVSSAGWNVDFALIYEECHWTPDQDNWGQTRIKDWESCTYRKANQSFTRRGPHALY
ncbi:hypothetical protein SAMD00023353_2001730 [Rosellinia necatrix]|uniref:Uncharacterized protein n=1 Tax=Rosellinia necatrix TaxID=77044 RepID=A0A1W2TEW7_ROSNE|nr:hypothetical protein SAMD00023353_2001730 [Rosellinia necatrix]